MLATEDANTGEEMEVSLTGAEKALFTQTYESRMLMLHRNFYIYRWQIELCFLYGFV